MPHPIFQVPPDSYATYLVSASLLCTCNLSSASQMSASLLSVTLGSVASAHHQLSLLPGSSLAKVQLPICAVYWTQYRFSYLTMLWPLSQSCKRGLPFHIRLYNQVCDSFILFVYNVFDTQRFNKTKIVMLVKD